VTDVVYFSNTPCIFTKADNLFNATVERLKGVLPSADFQHIGSTAIPGSLTKGDLDIVVRVPPEDFDEAEHCLAALFERNYGSTRNRVFSSFQDRMSDPELGLQLVAIGSEFDHFHTWRRLLEGDIQLRHSYDELKRRFQGRSIKLYRDAKAEFIDNVLRANNPMQRTV
jgi:GrpB-like predicted nucleotidyltransferase (UPF0157 family)